MNPEMIELAKRAVACKGWRWMPGMLAVPTEGMVTAPLRLMDDRDWPHDLGLRLPDLTDPATLGCLLALVREAWGAPRALVRLSSNGKSFHVFDVDRVTVGGNWAAWLSDDRCPTEAHALVAALEAK